MGPPVSMDFGGDRDSGCKQPVWARWIGALGCTWNAWMCEIPPRQQRARTTDVEAGIVGPDAAVVPVAERARGRGWGEVRVGCAWTTWCPSTARGPGSRRPARARMGCYTYRQGPGRRHGMWDEGRGAWDSSRQKSRCTTLTCILRRASIGFSRVPTFPTLPAFEGRAWEACTVGGVLAAV